ncbi:MAG: zinc-binding dehydrogenase [Clostridia bacterium]|nr:zinc-binding dehydrogenase [Clostridia bacterium]
MKETQTALRKLEAGEGHVELREIPRIHPKKDEVLIRVHAAGICGTDLKIRAGKTWSNPPVTLGHELSGVVEEVGEDVDSYKPGDRVVTETAQIICGKCRFCRTGNYLMCQKRLSIGYGTDGGMTQFIAVREPIVHRVPDNVSLDEASLCEPCAVAVHAVYDSVVIKPGDTVLVFGCGAIGNLVSQLALSFGATVILSGLSNDKNRLEIARSLGVQYPVNSEETDLQKFVLDLTDGFGADIVFECSGAASAVRSGMSLLRAKGSFVQVGLTKPTLEIEYSLLTGREIRLFGTFGHKWDSWETALKLLKTGKINTKALITDRVSLEDWEKGFDSASSGQGLKVLIYPSGVPAGE